MAIEFNQPVKHGRQQFIPGVSVAFDDPDAEPYFIAAGWASPTTVTPLFTYTEASVQVDPLTRFPSGGFVQPDVAQAHIDFHGGNPPLPAHETEFTSGLIAPAAEA